MDTRALQALIEQARDTAGVPSPYPKPGSAMLYNPWRQTQRPISPGDDQSVLDALKLSLIHI